MLLLLLLLCAISGHTTIGILLLLIPWLQKLLLLVSHLRVLLLHPVVSGRHPHGLLVLLLGRVALSSHRVSVITSHELIVLELIIYLGLLLLLLSSISELVLLLEVLDWLVLGVCV